jgi:predicted nucleic acid-binding protein
LAIESTFEPLWSSSILDELAYETRQKLRHSGVTITQAELDSAKLLTEMRRTFPEAECRYFDSAPPRRRLPDAGDDHVVEAAIAGSATHIVTNNLKDFPPDAMSDSLQIVTPSDFVTDIGLRDSNACWRALEAMASRSGERGPKQSPAEILEGLARVYKWTALAEFLVTQLPDRIRRPIL